MHELSIAEAILDAVRLEAEKRPGAHVAKVAVRVGALSGVEPDALSFGFACLVQGTNLAPLELIIEHVSRRQRCPSCDLTFDVPDERIEMSPESNISGELAIGSSGHRKEPVAAPSGQQSVEGPAAAQGQVLNDPMAKSPDDPILRTSDFGLSLACPRCGEARTILAGGEELQVAYLEFEEQ